MNRPTHCSDCGKPFPIHGPEHTGGTGRVILPSDAEICYSCAFERAKADMRISDAAPAYVASNAHGLPLKVTTWSGETLGDVIKCKAIRCFGQARYNLTIRAFDGSMWTARATAEGMYCTLRRVKGGA